MAAIEKRIAVLESTAKPPQMNVPILMFHLGDGNITASFKDKDYNSLPEETAEMFQARIEEDQGRELFGIVIVPLRKENKK